MATSTQSSLDNLRIQAVNNYKTWLDNYNETNGPIKREDLVTIPPGFLLPRPYNSSTGAVLNGTSGQFLKTNGSGGVEWADVVALPTQDSTTANKFLKSNGISGAAWEDVVALPVQSSSTNGQFLKSNGTSGAAWEALPSNLFVCTYGTTTSAQIEEAYQAGKICVVCCNGGYSNAETPLTICFLTVRNSATKHVFANAEWYIGSNSSDGPYINYAICDNDTWSTGGPRLAPANHASSATTYGVGNASNHGHLKLSNSISSSSGENNGIAATPAAVKSAYDLANTTSNNVIQLQDDFKEISGVFVEAPSDGIYAYEAYALSTDGDIYQCVNSAGTSETPGSNSSSWSLVGSDLISMITSKITYGTTDLTAGSSDLETGTIYVCYE